MLAHTAGHYAPIDYIHIVFALGIMAAYMSIPFISRLRHLPLTRTTRTAGTFFFATCAITHLAIAAGFHDSHWMLLNDTIQLIAVVTFIVSLTHHLNAAIRHKEARQRREAT
jgi:hypothetical protein